MDSYKFLMELDGTEAVADLEIFKGGGDFFEGRGDYREKPFFEAHLR
jgi:hypothetical protein